MDPQTQTPDPDFTSLTGVMKRFYEVPYVQFQQELNEYFDKNFPCSQEELPPSQRQSMLKFKEQVMQLANDLFAQAGMVQQCKDLIK